MHANKRHSKIVCETRPDMQITSVKKCCLLNKQYKFNNWDPMRVGEQTTIISSQSMYGT